MLEKLNKYLEEMVKLNASDLHIRVGSSPVFRIDGKLKASEFPPLNPVDTKSIAMALFNEKQQQDFEKYQECDLSYSAEGLGRFRINVFVERGNIHLALRFVPSNFPTFAELNLPPALEKICENQRGMILVTGTTGCGKSTTLAAMINYINERRSCHIITVEDPIEHLHKDKKAIIWESFENF